MKEENAIILEYLPHGYPLSNKRLPIVQAIGENGLVLLELIPRRGETFEIGEKVYIGEGKRDKISYILGRLHRENLTETAKHNLQEFIEEYVKNNEETFVKFFNESTAINKRIHQIELLPGMGKKFMVEILEKRKEESFDSFEDIRTRIQNLPFPEKTIEKRIFQELTNRERYNLFTN